MTWRVRRVSKRACDASRPDHNHICYKLPLRSGILIFLMNLFLEIKNIIPVYKSIGMFDTVSVFIKFVFGANWQREIVSGILSHQILSLEGIVIHLESDAASALQPLVPYSN